MFQSNRSLPCRDRILKSTKTTFLLEYRRENNKEFYYTTDLVYKTTHAKAVYNSHHVRNNLIFR